MKPTSSQIMSIFYRMIWLNTNPTETQLLKKKNSIFFSYNKSIEPLCVAAVQQMIYAGFDPHLEFRNHFGVSTNRYADRNKTSCIWPFIFHCKGTPFPVSGRLWFISRTLGGIFCPGDKLIIFRIRWSSNKIHLHTICLSPYRTTRVDQENLLELAVRYN